MPWLWKGGEKPKHLTPKKVLVLGPDEMYDSDYPFVKRVLDEFTVRLEYFDVVVMGNGTKHKIEDRRKVYFGTDRVAIRWCDEYKLTRHMLPLGNYDSGKERNRDLRNTLGDWGAYCVWFRDEEDQLSEWVYNQVVRELVSPKRTKVVNV